MKKAILTVSILLLISLSVVPNVSTAQEEPQKQDVLVVTRQKKAPFALVITNGKLALKNWKIHFYSMKENNTYRVIKDGQTLAKGSFSEFHKVVEVSVSKGSIKLLKIKLNGYSYTWKNINIMRKTPSKKEVQEAAKEKTVKIGKWEFTRTRLMFSSVGALAALAAMLFMRVVVKRKMENEILEGL